MINVGSFEANFLYHDWIDQKSRAIIVNLILL